VYSHISVYVLFMIQLGGDATKTREHVETVEEIVNISYVCTHRYVYIMYNCATEHKCVFMSRLWEGGGE